MAEQKTNYTTYLNSLTSTLETYMVQKAPPLPASWKGFIVKILPWLIIISLIFTIPAILAAFGLTTFLLPMSFLPIIAGIGFAFTLSLIINALGVVLKIMALPGLFKHTKRGWSLLYYSVLLGAVANLIVFNIIGLVIGTLISLYILFQIRSYYK